MQKFKFDPERETGGRTPSFHPEDLCLSSVPPEENLELETSFIESHRVY